MGGLEVQPKPSQESDVSMFKCYLRYLTKDFTLALILPAKVPLGVACYARNQITEFIHANVDLRYHLLSTQMKVQQVSNLPFSLPALQQQELSQR